MPFKEYYWVKVPDSYSQANTLLNKFSDDRRILVLPMLPDHGVRYYWDYRGDESNRFLFDRSAISKYIKNNYYSDKYLKLKRELESGGDYEAVLKEFNVGYLVLDRSIDWEKVGAVSPEVYRKVISVNPNFRQLGIIGELEIYKFDTDGSLFDVKSDKKIMVSYQKLSPTYYKVLIKNSQSPYELIFKTTYNDKWKAFIGKFEIKEKFIAYTYANGWKIEKEGDYEIEIKFAPDLPFLLQFVKVNNSY